MGLWATWFSQHSPLLLLCLAASRLGPLAKMWPNCESANSWMPPWTSQKTADLMTNFQLHSIWSHVLTSKTYETPSSMPQKRKNDQNSKSRIPSVSCLAEYSNHTNAGAFKPTLKYPQQSPEDWNLQWTRFMKVRGRVCSMRSPIKAFSGLVWLTGPKKNY